MDKTLVILTGPQGSGNHLWSKILSLHEDVFGWKSLLDNYWEAHRISEPFAEYWKNPDKLCDFDWSQSEYYFTSIKVMVMMSLVLAIYIYLILAVLLL